MTPPHITAAQARRGAVKLDDLVSFDVIEVTRRTSYGVVVSIDGYRKRCVIASNGKRFKRSLKNVRVSSRGKSCKN